MTKSEIFNNVWQYFIVQKHPRATVDGNCQYRGSVSNCAVGCQLPDKLYAPVMDEENIPVTGLYNKFPAVKKYFGESNESLLFDLQDAHDQHFPELEMTLRRIAKEFKITIKK